MAETLVRGRSVLTGDAQMPMLADGAVLVRDGIITEIGPADGLQARYRPETVIGGPAKIVMPGLVSAHQHGGGVSSVQLGCPDQRFERWLLRMLAIPALDPYLDTLYRAARFIESGITTTIHSHYVRDWADPGAEAASILSAYRKSRLRVAFAPCFLEQNLLAYGPGAEALRSVPADARAWLDAIATSLPPVGRYCDWITDLRTAFHDPKRLRILLGPVAPQWCSMKSLQVMAGKVGAVGGLHTHLLESPAQRTYLDSWLGRSVVTMLDELGLLGPTTSLAHAVHIRQPEVELLASRGAHVVTCPGSNLRLGNGITPVAQLADAGVPVAVGTDDMAAADDDDLLAEGRLMSLLQRPLGRWLPAGHMLAMLTSAGAAAALFADVTGRIAPGHHADLVLLDTTRLDEPATDPELSDLELVVARAAARDVHTVLIDGAVMYCEGQHMWINRADVVSALSEVVRAQAGTESHQRANLLSKKFADWHDRFSAALEPSR